MKPQPRPALAVKPASMWRPRGERGLPSCLARFLTLARGFPRWRGLRSRGAGSPLTNVPVSRQQAPARPCHSCLPHGPRESACGCPFQVKSSGKRQVPPPRPPKRLQDPSASSSRGSPGCSQCRAGPRPETEGTQASLGGRKSRSRSAGSVPPILIPIPSPPPAQRTRLSLGTGLGRASGKGLGKPVQAARSGPARARGLDVSPRALEWQRPPGRSGDEVARGALGGDLRAPGLPELGRQCCPRDRAWGLGKPEGRRSVDAGAAAGSRRPPAPRGDQF